MKSHIGLFKAGNSDLNLTGSTAIVAAKAFGDPSGRLKTMIQPIESFSIEAVANGCTAGSEK